jgi:glutamine amidotransferase-like uncharacterized protein
LREIVMRAGLYAGPGTSTASVLWKQRFLRDHGWQTTKIGPHELKTPASAARFDLLVLPGGESKAYDTALGMDGYNTLRQFGGTVWGACAGAFFLSADSVWQPGTPGLIRRRRQHAIFGGRAVGPYHAGQLTGTGSSVELIWPDGEHSYARCFRGPIFTGLGPHDVLLATYANRDHACGGVVCPTPGGGRAILTGFHPEMDWTTGLGDMVRFWQPKPPNWDEGVARTRARFMALLTV